MEQETRIKVVFEGDEASSNGTEEFWGDGQVFKLLLESKGIHPSLNGEGAVDVGHWFGESVKAKAVVVDAADRNKAHGEQVIRKEEWTRKVCEEISATAEKDATEAINALEEGRGVLITGASGCGKTILIEAIAKAKFKVEEICCIKGGLVDSDSALPQLISRIDNCSGIVVLDDVERLLPKLKSTGLDRQRTCLLVRCIRRAIIRNVPVIAATSRPESVDPTGLEYGVLDWSRRIRAPDHNERVAMISKRKVDRTLCEWIAQRTGGWSRAEIDGFVRAAYLYGHQSANMLDIEPKLEKLMEHARKNTSIYREAAFAPPDDLDIDEGFNQESFASSMIGGLQPVLSLLDKAVVSFLRNSAESGTRGILLHGPSGNGKTLIGTTLGRYIQWFGLANFVSVRCLDLVSKVVGETEANVSRVFARARDCNPCVLFLDQLDALAPKRSEESDTTERTFERVLSVLLVELDGILTKDFTGKVVVIAAVREVNDLEPAVVRPGRLGTHVYVGLPETTDERIAMLQVCTRQIPLKVGDGFFQHASRDLLQGKTRAEIANVCREAAMLALRDDLGAENVSEEHFLRVINRH